MTVCVCALFAHAQTDTIRYVHPNGAYNNDGRSWETAMNRVQDAIYILTGVHWKNVRVGLSYDLTTSRLGTYKPGRSIGSVELYLKYCFKVSVPRKPNTVYGNTIYLD